MSSPNPYLKMLNEVLNFVDLTFIWEDPYRLDTSWHIGTQLNFRFGHPLDLHAADVGLALMMTVDSLNKKGLNKITVEDLVRMGRFAQQYQSLEKFLQKHPNCQTWVEAKTFFEEPLPTVLKPGKKKKSASCGNKGK